MTWFLVREVEGKNNRYFPAVGLFTNSVTGEQKIDVWRWTSRKWKQVDRDWDQYFPDPARNKLEKAFGRWNQYEKMSRIIADDNKNLDYTDDLGELLKEFPWGAAQFAGLTVSLDEDGNIDRIYLHGEDITDVDFDDEPEEAPIANDASAVAEEDVDPEQFVHDVMQDVKGKHAGPESDEVVKTRAMIRDFTDRLRSVINNNNAAEKAD